MFNIALEKATYKPGDTRSAKQTAQNVGDMRNMQKQANM